MGKHITFLITLLQTSEMCGMTTLQCALKIDKTNFESDWYDYPMEKDSREIIHALLPMHVQSVGPIIDVKTIFDCKIV